MKINAHFHEQGSVLRGDAEGFADAFEIDISMESDAPESTIRELMRLAHQMCFTEKALSGVPFTIRHTLNGQPLSD
ncbi:MAG TPA: hypothetical protein VFF68_04190 [Anaerolineaceae bacterium]|nr:hypothetical protein [Anaerolineaceae bacterium]